MPWAQPLEPKGGLPPISLTRLAAWRDAAQARAAPQAEAAATTAVQPEAPSEGPARSETKRAAGKVTRRATSWSREAGGARERRSRSEGVGVGTRWEKDAAEESEPRGKRPSGGPGL